jgi:hypothetical protein
MARVAWGNHVTLAALCGMLRERHGLRAHVKVWRLDGRIDDVREPNADAGAPEVTLNVAYTGDHYLSIIKSTASPKCARQHGAHAT